MKKLYIQLIVVFSIFSMFFMSANLLASKSKTKSEMKIKTNIENWIEKQYYETSLDGMNGIIETNVDLKSGDIKISYYSQDISAEKILDAVDALKNKKQYIDNYPKISDNIMKIIKEIKFQTTADNWIAKNELEAALNNLCGIIESDLNISTGNMKVLYNPDEIKVEKILELIKNLGYEAIVCSDNNMSFN